MKPTLSKRTLLIGLLALLTGIGALALLGVRAQVRVETTFVALAPRVSDFMRRDQSAESLDAYLASQPTTPVPAPHDYPVHLAVSWGRADLVKVLVKHGYSANEEWPYDPPQFKPAIPILRAIEADDPEMIRLLVELGARLDSTGLHGESLLRFAQQRQKMRAYETLEELIAHDRSSVPDGGE